MLPAMWNAQQVADWNAAADSERSLCVAWLLNPGQPPRPGVRVTVHGDQITDVTSVADDQQGEVLPVVLLPRLVNAHTHLEFSLLLQPLSPSRPFTEWIQSVMRHRRAHDNQRRIGISSGLDESCRAGASAIGEISTSDGFEQYSNSTRLHVDVASHDEAARLSVQERVQIVCFRELIGLLPEQIDAMAETAANHLARERPDNIRAGLSPHAPYSVHPDLFDAAVDLSAKYDSPVAMHLAETRDELQLLHDRIRPFVDFLRKLGLWRPSVFRQPTTPLRYLRKMAELPGSLAIHGNYFSDAELQFLCRNPQVATVYCPRTHHYFGHTPHPWKKLLNEGATVVIGTDSRASNPDLSVWKELQFLARLPQSLPWPQLVELATTQAERLFGQTPKQLQPGHCADGLLVFCNSDSASELDRKLAREESQPAAVLCGGQIALTT